jgi:hypothetical protein
MAKEIYLTQYGLMAERHWREFRPNMVRQLEAKGVLHEQQVETDLRRATEICACQRKSSPPVNTAVHGNM